MEAKKLFDEAQLMLKEIIDKKILRATGIVGFYPANSEEDDILVYSDEERLEPICTFFGLRQQAEKVIVNFLTSLGFRIG
jgi:5-methyltetrahydrofolate--homocysteine methyltransferase